MTNSSADIMSLRLAVSDDAIDDPGISISTVWRVYVSNSSGTRPGDLHCHGCFHDGLDTPSLKDVFIFFRF